MYYRKIVMEKNVNESLNVNQMNRIEKNENFEAPLLSYLYRKMKPISKYVTNPYPKQRISRDFPERSLAIHSFESIGFNNSFLFFLELIDYERLWYAYCP